MNAARSVRWSCRLARSHLSADLRSGVGKASFAVPALAVLFVAGAAMGGESSAPTGQGATSTTARTAVSGNVSIPAHGAYWGAFVDDRLASIGQRETRVGRRFGIVHYYHDWYQSWGGARSEEKRLADKGQIIFDSIISRSYTTGAIIPWARVANGSKDARIDRLAEYAKSLGRPMFVSFHVEPETDIGVYGTAGDYVAAFRHLVLRFRADGVRNVSWVWQTEGYSEHYSEYPSLYPGARFVDWIAWDPFNFYTCHASRWQRFAAVVAPFYKWLMSNGYGMKPFMLGEYGTVEGDDGGGAKRRWFVDALASMKAGQFPNLKALVYFDSPKGCGWRVDSSTASLDGFRRMGADGYFKPPRVARLVGAPRGDKPRGPGAAAKTK